MHRDVAPVLAGTLRGWLPRVTEGRYTDATVDPETLEVQVCGPRRRWRRAALLSQGTREQIYLLLRMALVEHLTSDPLVQWAWSPGGSRTLPPIGQSEFRDLVRTASGMADITCKRCRL